MIKYLKFNDTYLGLLAFMAMFQALHMYGMSLKECKVVAFDENRDTAFLKYLFRHDRAMLLGSKKPKYKDVDDVDLGVKTFKNCASDALINDRKILTVNDSPVSFVIYFIAQKNNVKHLQDGDGVMPLMGVHPDFRNLGYGKKTMEYVISWFKDQKSQQVWLSVNKNNFKAQGLYKQCGFENTGMSSWGDSFWWVLPISMGYKSLYLTKKDQLANVRFAFE